MARTWKATSCSRAATSSWCRKVLRQGRGSRALTARRRIVLLSAAAIACCAGWRAASAAEWKLTTYLGQTVLYNDNLLLSRRNEIDAIGFTTTPHLILERNTPTLTIKLDGRFEFNEYIDHSNFNSQDQFIDLNVEKLLSERSRLNLAADLIRDTTLRSEQDASDRFLDDSIRFVTVRANPSWTYRLTELDDISLSGNYRNTSYDSADKTDYQSYGPTIGYDRRLSELDKFTSSLSYLHFDPEGKASSDRLGLLAGYAYEPSERLLLSGQGGLSYDLNDGDVGYRARINARYLLDDQTALRALLSHDIEPSGDGQLRTRNRASVGVTYKATELTTLGLAVDYTDNYDYGLSGSTEEDNDEESRYYSVRPSVAWQIAEDWDLVAEYRYRHKAFEEGDSATSNAVLLTLRYRLPTLTGEGF